MAELTISLSNVRNVKRVHIDEFGDFKVRKMGAGEELDLSDKLRRLNEIIEELNLLDFKHVNIKNPTKKDIAELSRLTKRSEAFMDEINDIKRYEIATYARLFDDGGDGSKTQELLSSLSDEDRAELLKRIFEPAKIIEKSAEPIAPIEGVADDVPAVEEEPLKPLPPSPSPSTEQA